MYRRDTIVACGTPPGRGAIAVLRLSGPDTARIVKTLFEPRSGQVASPWMLQRGTIIDPDGAVPVDDVLVVQMPAPRTYTGEDMAEIHCHGAPVIVDHIIAAATALGARSAERGEFTRRAVLNGKMDLLQAEAVADLVDASVDSGAADAWQQLQGALSQKLATIRLGLVTLLADIEANVDFSDDELPDENVPARMSLLQSARDAIGKLLSGFAAARRRREGFRTVLIGQPNVGKSSLVNALLGTGRMIVTDEPGTTRDIVEELVDFGGCAFLLTDTAGIRETDSRAETAAVERTLEIAESAAFTLLVLDGGSALSARDEALLADLDAETSFVVVNKSDLPAVIDEARIARLSGAPCLRVSAKTQAGCEDLAQTLARAARLADEREPVGVSRVRHRGALERADGALSVAAALIRRADSPELVAIELRDALDELAGITEPLDNEEVLDIIFGEFCIGK